PDAAQHGVVHAPENACVLQRHDPLIAIAVQRPGANLVDAAPAAMQAAVERVQVVVALRADPAERRLQVIGAHQPCHSVSSMPSCAISQPSASTAARSALPGRQTGLVLLMWT